MKLNGYWLVRSQPPLFAHAGLVVLAVCLGIAGGGRLAEGWRLDPMNAYVHAEWWGLSKQVLPDGLTGWQPKNADGRAWAGYSQAALDWANTRGEVVPFETGAETAANAVERALTLAPGQPAAWARLSLLRLNHDHMRGAAEALAFSLKLGPRVSNLAWLRSRLGLFLWQYLSDSEKRSIEGDIRRLWHQRPSVGLLYPQDALIRFAHSIGQLDAVREALPIGERPQLNRRIASVLQEVAGAS